MGLYLNLENGEKIDYQGDEYLPDGTNVVLAKTYKKNNQNVPKYKAIVTVVHPEKGEKEITDDLLDAAIAKGYQTKQIADAKGEGYDKAQVGKRGEVGPIEASARGAGQGVFGIGDEVVAGAKNPVGFAKAAINYVAPDSMDFDENDPKLKAYRAETEVQRARDDRGWEEEPLAYGSGMTLGSVAAPGGVVAKGVSKLARVGSGAALGVGNAIGGSENESIYDDGSSLALGGAIGGALPALGAAVEGAGQSIRGKLAKKGEGAGEKYLDNPELLTENLGAADRADDISTGIKGRNQTLNEQLVPIDKKVGQFEEMSNKVQVDRANQVSKMDDDILAETEKLGGAKANAANGVKEFQRAKSKEAYSEIETLNKQFNDELEKMGTARDARLEELEAFGATDKARQAYQNLKAKLRTNLGMMHGKESAEATAILDNYLPDETVELMTQGQLLKHMKRVKDDLWNNVKGAEGSGQNNHYKAQVAGDVQQAWESTGQNDVIKMTSDMSPIWHNRDGLQKGAMKQVPGRRGASDRSAKVFDAAPNRAENASPKTLESLKTSGYEPKITKQVQAEQARLDKEIEKLEFRTKILISGRDSLKKAPPAMSMQMDALKAQRNRLTESVKSSNVDDSRRLIDENAKTDDINSLYGRQSGPEAAGGAVLDVAGQLIPNAAYRGARRGVSAITDPVRQIELYNYVREKFQKPALTAAVRALTLGGRTLSNSTIRGLAEQHKVDPAEFEQTVRDGGN